MTEVSASGELSWLLRNLGARVAHVRQAVVLSADGLTMGSSLGFQAERCGAPAGPSGRGSVAGV
jgi:predicted regulator of Ras-like GTPase activity (Roadblock/LC7/MglB family)